MKKILISLLTFSLFFIFTPTSANATTSFTASNVSYDYSTGTLDFDYTANVDFQALRHAYIIDTTTNTTTYDESGITGYECTSSHCHFVYTIDTHNAPVTGHAYQLEIIYNPTNEAYLSQSLNYPTDFTPVSTPTPTPENAPVTTANLAIQNFDGTYSDPTTVTLSSTAASGNTIANTYYTIDGGAQQTYSAPFTVTGHGSHTITYWSVDNLGVTEATNTKTFTIPSYFTASNVSYDYSTGILDFDYTADVDFQANRHAYLIDTTTGTTTYQDSGTTGYECNSSHCHFVFTLDTHNAPVTGHSYLLEIIYSPTNEEYLSQSLNYPTDFGSISTPTPTPTPLPKYNVTGYDHTTGTFTISSSVNPTGCTNVYLYKDTFPGGVNLATAANPTCTSTTIQDDNFKNLGDHANVFLNFVTDTEYSSNDFQLGKPVLTTRQYTVNGYDAATGTFTISSPIDPTNCSNVYLYQNTFPGGSNITTAANPSCTATTIQDNNFKNLGNRYSIFLNFVTDTEYASSDFNLPFATQIASINTGGNTVGNFAADTGFSGGGQYTTTNSVDTSGVTNPAPDSVYQSVRYGNFSYTIPNLTANASYTVRLHFNELYWTSAGQRVFNVSANGQQVLSNFDIYQAAGGANKAVVEEVPATADANGTVTLQFSTVTDNAMVNGIEMYTGSPTTTPTPTPPTPLVINAGGASSGNFTADTEFNGGSTYTTTNSVDTSSVTNPAPQNVYQSVRYGNFSYTMANLTPNINYLVKLHFNELYWNSAGQRVFNVAINGSQVLSNFDVYQAAGGANKAVVEQFVKPADATGKITITFTSVVDNALVSGIELGDGSSVPTYTLTGNVYNDANQNGFQDTGEDGYNGATVSLDNGDSTTTDNNGNYTFSNLIAGSYTEHLTLPNGYSGTTQNPVNVAVTANTTQNFGIVQANYAINTGGAGVGTFLSDQNFTGGQTYNTSNAVDTSGVTNPAPDAVYQTVRYGNFSYTISNLTPNSTHTVRLHFDEFYWNSVGSRVFNVSANGTQVLSNYDIFQAAGGKDKAVTEDVPATVDGNGNIILQFSTVTDNAMVNGIEVLN